MSEEKTFEPTSERWRRKKKKKKASLVKTDKKIKLKKKASQIKGIISAKGLNRKKPGGF